MIANYVCCVSTITNIVFRLQNSANNLEEPGHAGISPIYMEAGSSENKPSVISARSDSRQGDLFIYLFLCEILALPEVAVSWVFFFFFSEFTLAKVGLGHFTPPL